MPCGCPVAFASVVALLRRTYAVVHPELAAGAGGNAYEDRKSALFDELLALWPTHPAGGRAIPR